MKFQKIEDSKSILESLLYDRRSIRKYKPDMPEEKMIESMISCASMAPSPSNKQPVRFVRIRSREKLKCIEESLSSGYEKLLGILEEGAKSKKIEKPGKIKTLINYYRRFSVFMFDAPVLLGVGVITDVSGFSQILHNAGLLKKVDNWDTNADMSVGLALKGLILRGKELGLGTCILTAPLVFINNPEEILGIENIKIKCFVTIGFPDETPSASSRKIISEIYQDV